MLMLNDVWSMAPNKKSKRVGRGIGSGLGKTCGRGHKGQRSRSGGRKPNFEGGQTRLQMRIPKFGFNSLTNGKGIAELKLYQINSIFKASEMVSIQTLCQKGIIGNNIRTVRIISSGQIDKPLMFEGVYLTDGAKELVKNAGGTFKELPTKLKVKKLPKKNKI